MKNLFKIRIVFSSSVFILFLLLFLGGEKISTFLAPILLPLQFTPALIHVLTKPTTLFVLGFVFIIGVSFIFGRVYCSFLCPLGILQDFFILLSRKLKLRSKHSFQKQNNIIRYSLLGLTFGSAIIGSLALVNLLDPYSILGRIINHIGEQLFGWLFNAVATFLQHFNIYIFARSINYLPISVFLVTMIFFILILLMTFSAGRLYCNTICPVGTLLGLIARVSLFKFDIDPTNCNECRKCESVCKAGCIDTGKMSLDQSRCVSCFNCLHVCPQSVISYQPSFKKITKVDFSPQRRSFIITSASVAGLIIFTLNSNIRNPVGNLFAKKVDMPITPPGSLGFTHYSQTCSACHLCVSACPTKVITPAFMEYGLAGIMQPKMDYEKSYCDYECNICGRVCPTGAIRPFTLQDKKLIQVGTAELLQDRCVVYTKKQNCGACLEVCPTHTLYSINENNILYPKTDLQYCIGCGACEKACPTAPKSIIVRSNQIHKKAIKYVAKAEPIQQKNKIDKSFPF